MKWSLMLPGRREALRNGSSPLDHEEIVSSFYQWCHYPARSFLHNYISGEVLPVMDCRRGNSKYAAKNRKVMDHVSYAVENNVLIDRVEDGSDTGYSRGLFITLTMDPHAMSEAESWNIKSDSLRYFKAAFSRVLKRHGLSGHYVSYHVAEAHSSGYCHIHLFVILEELVPIFLKRSRKAKISTSSYYWRLQDYDLILDCKAAWSRSVYHALCKLREEPYSRSCKLSRRYAFNDVQAVVGSSVTGDDRKRSGVVSYLLKYLSKAPRQSDKKALLTLAYQKLFGVRSIFGKKFLWRIGLGEEYSRHDTIKNELQQIKFEWAKKQRELGSMIYPGNEADRLRSYAIAIHEGKIPYEAVEQRILNDYPFSWYSRYEPEIYYDSMKKPKIWNFLFHARFFSEVMAAETDKAFRKYKIDWGEISLISDELAPDKKKIFSSSWKEALKTIICLEGLDDCSPDFDRLLC